MWAHTGGETRKCAFILERRTQVSPALLVKCPGLEITARGSHQPRVSCSLWIHLKYLPCTNSMWGYLDKIKLPQVCSGELSPPAQAADGKAQPHGCAHGAWVVWVSGAASCQSTPAVISASPTSCPLDPEGIERFVECHTFSRCPTVFKPLETFNAENKMPLIFQAISVQ